MLRIVTDSSSEITGEEAKALDVQVVPLTVVFGNTAYLDGVELSKKEFYEKLQTGEFPHTSQPSVEQFSEVFAKTAGEETLVLLISSRLSGAVNAARLAKEGGNFSRVHIYDSLCTTVMLRLLVETAVKHRSKSAEEVIAILDALRPRIRLYACLGTLEYLRKGGRLKKSAAALGELLGIKPIVTVGAEGTVDLIGKAHGQKKALYAVAQKFLREEADPAYPVCFLQTDSDLPPREIMKAVGRENCRIFPINCAVGAHIGPNAAGIVYVAKE